MPHSLHKKKHRMKQSCWWLSSLEGISCNGYRTKQTALKAMLELWNDDLEYHKGKYGDITLTEEQIKEEEAVFCESCSYYTINSDDKTCQECGETKKYTIKTFTIYFI